MRSCLPILLVALGGLVGCPSPAAPPPPPDVPEPPPPPPPDVPVALPPDAVTSVSTFKDHHCVVRADGRVACWGRNSYGQLGGQNREEQSELVVVEGVTGAKAVGVGRDFSCAVLTDQTVRCWGNHEDGQLGDGRGVEPGALSLRPVEVVGLRGVEQLTLGEYHACALTGDGVVHCWGNGADGQLGRTVKRADGTPRPVEDLARVTAVAAGASHTCAIVKGGAVRCWGRHTEGQLGSAVSGGRANHVAVDDLRDAKTLASGHTHTCAIRKRGGVVCWGDNKAGQLGPAGGADKRHKHFVEVPGLEGVTQLALGGQHSCALTRKRELSCWGANDKGQLDGDAGGGQSEPKAVAKGRGASMIALGEAQTCAILDAGRATCWGTAPRDLAPTGN